MNDQDHRLALPSPNVVQVWAIFLPDVRSDLESLRGILSPEERERAARFVFERDQQRFILGRGTLRVLLSRYLSRDPSRIEFQYGPRGKPALATEKQSPPALRFNLSHSGDYCLCAIALRREVGIDIETVRPDVECLQLAERFFTRREYEDLRQMPEESRQARFFRYWTCKEACLKARGKGILSGLARFEVVFNADGLDGSCKATAGVTVPEQGLTVRVVPIAEHVAAAVAAEGDTWEVVVCHYPVK